MYILVLSDAHCHPDDDFSRFDQIGRLILEEKPDAVVNLGDFGSVDSLSRHGDTPKHNLKEDLRCMLEAQQRMFKPLEEWNERQRWSKHRPHRMSMLMVEGNHEERRDRVAKEDPYGYACIADLGNLYGYRHYWDAVRPYGDVFELGDCWFGHAVLSAFGRPLALSTVAKQSEGHTFVGHGHDLQVLTTPTHAGVRLTMSCPAFMVDDYLPDYAKRSHTGWTYGFVKLYTQGRHKAPGYEYVTMKDLATQYG